MNDTSPRGPVRPSPVRPATRPCPASITGTPERLQVRAYSDLTEIEDGIGLLSPRMRWVCVGCCEVHQALITVEQANHHAGRGVRRYRTPFHEGADAKHANNVDPDGRD
jgi:hypothetical protein